MKIYLLVESALKIEPDNHHVTVKFGNKTTVGVGARSLHTTPAQRFTTTRAPEDMMEVISHLGTALKTTSVERSFPTLRGHPARITLGNDVDLPDGASPPDTDVEVSVPPKYEYIYPASTLAFYLGATLRPGSPALHADGTTHSLGPGNDRQEFEENVHELLQHTFTLDCIVRTEGYYQVDLFERERFEDTISVDYDLERLYDLPVAERLVDYLTIPFESTASVRPDWPVTTDMMPRAEYVEHIPFLLNNLALIRCPDVREELTTEGAPDPVADYFRSESDVGSSVPDTTETGAVDQWTSSSPTSTRSSPTGGGTTTREPFVRGVRSESETAPAVEPEAEPSLVSLPPTDSLSQTWVGEGLALGATKATIESYLRQLEHEPSSNPLTSVDVIINDDEMDEERDVTDIYRTHDLFEFDVEFHQGLTRAELQDRFATDTDFLHYVGHVDSRGMQCADGYLSAEKLETVGCDAFFLNACRSYRQGQLLIDRGALAGVVTVEEILNSSATNIGRMLARFINAGFPIQVALELIGEYAFFGTQYIGLGDGNAQIVQNASGTPTLVEIERLEEDCFDVSLWAYPPRNRGPGALYTPYVGDNERPYLNSGLLDSFTLSCGELEDFLGRESRPVIINQNLHWSDEIRPAEISYPPSR